MNQEFLTPITAASAVLGAWVVSRFRLPRPVRSKYISEDGEKGLSCAVGRVLEPHDGAYLAARPLNTHDLVRSLQASRKEFLKLYLQDLRAGFLRTSSSVRQFAAEADAPELALAALRQSIRFHLLWTALRLSLVWRPAGQAWRLIEKQLGSPRLLESAQDSGPVPASPSQPLRGGAPEAG